MTVSQTSASSLPQATAALDSRNHITHYLQAPISLLRKSGTFRKRPLLASTCSIPDSGLTIQVVKFALLSKQLFEIIRVPRCLYWGSEEKEEVLPLGSREILAILAFLGFR